MSQLEKEQKLAKQEKTTFQILWIPILILLTIVPLIVKLSAVSTSEVVGNLFETQTYGDFFSQYKAVGVILMSIIMVILVFLLFDKNKVKRDKQLLVYLIASIGFLGTALIATIFSEYREVALWGVPDRAEGFVILACYILIFFYTIYIFRNTEDYKRIVISLSILIVISTILGVFQYFGYDLLMKNEVLNKLILGTQYEHLAGNMQATYEEGKVYGTLYHYNYMGSFGALIVPLFIVLTLFIKGYKKKIALGFITLCSLFLLFGSTSRAGLIGLACSILVAIIIFGKILIKKWKLVVPVIALFIVILFGFNVVTDGTIFARIPTLVQDAFGIFMPGESGFDYKDHIPVRSITSQDGTTTVVMQNGSLTFGYLEGGLLIADEEGKAVQFDVKDGVGSTTDERFKALQFRLIALTEESESADGVILMFNGLECFVLKIDAEAGIYLIDNYTGEPLTIEEAPYWGFEGKEKLGSARGYIWSRSLPMLKDTWLIGNGPDTYAIEFPQDDLLAKWWAYDTPKMTVDKPHNLYLQIALNEGGLALVAFLVLVGAYIIDSFRLYALRSYYSSQEIMGIATALGVIGYLGAGIFNDSVISVAPIFWILLGVGVAINFMNNKERLEAKRRLSHATVNMKTRQHV